MSEPTPTMERDWPTEIREWADMELPATEAFLLEVADAFQKFAGLQAEIERYELARQEDAARIEQLSGWYNHAEKRVRENADVASELARRVDALTLENQCFADTLAEIELKSNWYADNAQRDPHEVDHALCVEILDLARRALDV